MLSVVKMLLKGAVGGRALNSHGNFIVDLTWKIIEKSWIVFLNFCGNPELYSHRHVSQFTVHPQSLGHAITPLKITWFKK